MHVLIYKKYWTEEIVEKDKKYVYIFGDNDISKGKGGQAIIRDCSNAMGIPTKKLPNNSKSSFYTDDEYEENVKKIDTAIDKIIRELEKNTYEGIVLPQDGLGTGLADLPTKAPKTFKYLNNSIDILIKKVESM